MTKFIQTIQKKNSILGAIAIVLIFVPLSVPAYLAITVVSLAPLSDNAQSFLIMACLIVGAGFASYGTYRIYKISPSTAKEIDSNAEPKEMTERGRAHQQ